jgi:hypothetical protein
VRALAADAAAAASPRRACRPSAACTWTRAAGRCMWQGQPLELTSARGGSAARAAGPARAGRGQGAAQRTGLRRRRTVQPDAIEVVALPAARRKQASTTGEADAVPAAGHRCGPGLSAEGTRVSPMSTAGPLSLRRRLLLGILVPVTVIVARSTASLYQQAARDADTRPTTARCWPRPRPSASCWTWWARQRPHCSADLPYAALEAFEADNRSRMYFRSGLQGRDGLGLRRPARTAAGIGRTRPYAALVHFYDDTYQGEPVRMAVLLQPVAGRPARAWHRSRWPRPGAAPAWHACWLDTLWQQVALMA